MGHTDSVIEAYKAATAKAFELLTDRSTDFGNLETKRELENWVRLEEQIVSMGYIPVPSNTIGAIDSNGLQSADPHKPVILHARLAVETFYPRQSRPSP